RRVTTAPCTTPRSYGRTLTASDSDLRASDDATITILAKRPPAVNAGPDRQVTLPDAVTLDGSVTDDGLPLGSSVSAFWTKLLGPGRVGFDAASANAAEDFSTAANPNGAWSYGFTPTRGGTFTRYPVGGMLYFGLPA